MPHRGGWFPSRRDDVLHMADAWESQLDQHGTDWGVPEDKQTGFKTTLTGTKTLFEQVRSGERTPVNTEQCRILFRDLEVSMQFLKSNYFNSPPRTGDELVGLLLSVHDGTPTPIPPCDVVPGVSLHNTDGHGILLKLFTGAEPSDRRSADHFFGKWGIKPRGGWASMEEAASDPRLLTRQPVRASDLPEHISTSRKRHELPFGLADIGSELFVTVCWQTPRNQDGPYCPVLSRIIA